VAAPIIGAHIDPPAPARPPASAATHPVVVSTPASLAQAPVATVTTVPVTTTTAGPVTSTTLVNSAATAVGSSGTGGTAPAGAAGPVAKLASDGVVLDAGGGLTEEPGTLTIGSEAPIAGSLRTVVVLPAAGSQACTGSLLVRFLWTDAHLKTFEIDVKATFRSASVHGGSTDYALSGPATAAAGTPGVGKGPLEGSGTLAVPASGSAGALALSVSSSTGSPAPTCPAPDPTPSTSTTSTSTTSTTTVTHDTPTTAVGAAQAGS
jgi:hypothetical protein